MNFKMQINNGLDYMTVLNMVNPMINTYPIYANPLSILQTHNETYEWLLCNFIQICSNSQALNFYDFNYKLCPFLNIQRISKRWLKENKFDVIEFIVSNLSKGIYVYLLVKKNKIVAYDYSSEEDRFLDESVHDIMIYGYDIAQEEFYIADNFKHGKYSYNFKCSFLEMRMAIEGVDLAFESRLGFKGNIELLEYYDKEPRGFNVQRVYDSLCDYLEARPTTMWNTLEFRDKYGEEQWYFGISCYKYMLYRIEHLSFPTTHIQDFHLMWEHKKQLKRVIDYLINNNYIFSDFKLEGINSIVRDALISRNLVIKFLLTNDINIQSDIINKYNDIRSKEELILEYVISSLAQRNYIHKK